MMDRWRVGVRLFGGQAFRGFGEGGGATLDSGNIRRLFRHSQAFLCRTIYVSSQCDSQSVSVPHEAYIPSKQQTTEFKAFGALWKVEPWPTMFADGACMVTCGDTVVLATVHGRTRPAGSAPKISVEYKEKYYAAGKVPPAFQKREVAPKESEMRVSHRIERVIDSLIVREANQRKDVVIKLSVLSSHGENDPEMVAINAASAALATSRDIPWYGPVGAAKIIFERVKGSIECVPSTALAHGAHQHEDAKRSSMMVVCSAEGFVHVHGRSCHGLSSRLLTKGLETAKSQIQKFLLRYQLELSSCKARLGGSVLVQGADPAGGRRIYEPIKQWMIEYFSETPRHIYGFKQDAENILKPKIKEMCVAQGRWRSEHARIPGSGCVAMSDVDHTINALAELVIKTNFVGENKSRIDGRQSSEIARGSLELGSLPRSHGSCVYKAGNSMVVNAVTCGSLTEQSNHNQSIHGSASHRISCLYASNSHASHDNRQSSSAGKEDLVNAEFIENSFARALPPVEEVPFSFRSNSDAVAMDGPALSSSVMGVSAALYNIGLNLLWPVVSTTVGLSCLPVGAHEKDGEAKIITLNNEGVCNMEPTAEWDIVVDPDGLEAEYLDATLVCSGNDGKLSTWMFYRLRPREITLDMMSKMIDSLLNGQKDHLDNLQRQLKSQKAKARARFGHLSVPPSVLPKLLIDKGELLHKIEIETGGKVKVNDDGILNLFAPSQKQFAALEESLSAAAGAHLIPGRLYKATVVAIKDFGAFVKLPGSDIEALLHISEIANKRIASVEDELSLDQDIDVEFLGRDHLGNLRVSRKNCL